MAKNVIIMIGDGMGWEPARAAAIARQIEEGQAGNNLRDFYTQGTGQGLNFQTLENYSLATTYGTTIANENGRFSTGVSALDNSSSLTGNSLIRPGFEFSPEFNPGTEADGGALVVDGATGNLVGYDPLRGGVNPWTPGNDPEYIKHSYPDSANTATTLYTGVKSYNNAIGVDIFEQPLESILATANKIGKSTGLVSSVPIDHATPGAAAANVNRRNKYDDEFPSLDNILQQELREFQPTVLLGGGHPLSSVDEAPLPEGVEPDFTYITPETYSELSNNPQSNIYGYNFLERGNDAAQRLLANAATVDPEAGERLLGLYGARGQNGNLPVAGARGDFSPTGFDQFSLFSSTSGENQIPTPDLERPLAPGETDEEFIATERNENPTLNDLTTAALDVLEDDNEGFWLMVEGGDIDWALHDNNLDNLIGNVNQFDQAVGTVIDWIDNNGGWEENLLIVTADHDHYMTLNQNFPQLLRTQGAEALTYEAHQPNTAGHYFGSENDIKYGWGSHSNRPVPIYYQGSGSEVLDSLIGQGYQAYGNDVPGVDNLNDQIHIYQTMYAAVTNGAPPVPVPPVPDPNLQEIIPDEPTIRYAESGGDFLEAGTNEIIIGGDGNDFVDASVGGGDNRIYGRDGNDTLLGGFNGLLVGDRGEDAIYAGNGGNTLIGGPGRDQFWIAYGSIPNTANIITDFVPGTDVIGFSGLSDASTFEDLSIVASGSDSRILLTDTFLVIAVLENVQPESLTDQSFVFV
ncbi:alkaline phosphatase [Gloeocapsa sp. PCC 73106]|uniref:alkaline phosphatase n=1 Tax=Gloeocapsa sp. PCC 73106 TaxID=102232 RepID=UPI0002ABA26E|nr:alkaline phosphatase [Gloeocapsa sp. PCC 73106]ELR96279.1 Alkaline phosphatase [Gloeocapsa sp. PCC 73106]